MITLRGMNLRQILCVVAGGLAILSFFTESDVVLFAVAILLLAVSALVAKE